MVMLKYRRMWEAYISHMKQLEIDDAAVCAMFMRGYFSILKGNGNFVAIGGDHVGEQENLEQ